MGFLNKNSSFWDLFGNKTSTNKVFGDTGHNNWWFGGNGGSNTWTQLLKRNQEANRIEREQKAAALKAQAEAAAKAAAVAKAAADAKAALELKQKAIIGSPLKGMYSNFKHSGGSSGGGNRAPFTRPDNVDAPATNIGKMLRQASNVVAQRYADQGRNNGGFLSNIVKNKSQDHINTINAARDAAKVASESSV